ARPAAEKQSPPATKAAKPASSKKPAEPAGKPAEKVRRAPPRKDEFDENEFEALLAADRAEESTYVSAPPVLRKKKKPKPVEGPRKKKYQGEALPASEFLLPLGLAIVSLVVEIAVSLILAPEGLPRGWYVAFKLGFTLVSMVVTLLALFVA